METAVLSDAPSAAASLKDVELPGGWVATELVPRISSHTGGHYSVSYLALHKSGTKGFLKALDYSRAFGSPDRALAINELTAAYLHERTILERCANRKLRRIVRAIDHGSVALPGFALPVDYIVFERAEGDLRDQMDAMGEIDDLWRLRTLHQIATGMFELHGSGIAHQDVKPSNILDFAADGTKLGDLGRSACLAIPCPYDDVPVPGTRAYAPPELLYDRPLQDFDRRRFGCDAYLLGSMAVYLFLGCSATAALLAQLDPQHRPEQWRDGFSAVLPYLKKAFGSVLGEIEESLRPRPFGMEMVRVIAELCEPDPELRGHPGNRHTSTNRYSVERYVSIFDRLARRVEVSVLRTP
jgi:serine/threonine protein kinase